MAASATPVSTAAPEFIGVGCNRTTQAATWGASGLVAFAADRLVALYNPQDSTSRGVFATLQGHKDRVNCVEFIERGTESNRQDVALISGSADKTARIWKPKSNKTWTQTAVLNGHTSAINAVTTLMSRHPQNGSEPDTLATASADGTVRIWSREAGSQDEDDIVTCVQVINVGIRYAMSLAMTHLPGTRVPVLAVGGVDSRITIYVRRDGSGMFSKTVTLQGHENWIRGLAFAEHAPLSEPSEIAPNNVDMKSGDLILASASQDRYLRLWRFTIAREDIGDEAQCESVQNNTDEDLIDDDEEGSKRHDTVDLLASLRGASSAANEQGMQLSTKAHMFDVPLSVTSISGDTWTSGRRYTVLLEALLLGHDDWVHSVKWQRAQIVNGRYYQPLRVISGSADKSMIIWAPERETGVWVNMVRMGEMGGTSQLGFFGGEFSPDGRSVMAHSQAGTFHMWTNEGENDEQEWQPRVAISGHFAPVQDIAWEPLGRYFISVSTDRTARLFAPWRRTPSDLDHTVSTWHEIARPQVHGYDLQCIAFAGINRYVSGADEKVLRAFEAPETFDLSLDNIAGRETRKDEDKIVVDRRQKAVGASLPALGLSNKAVFLADLHAQKDEDDDTAPGGYEAEAPISAAMADALQTPPYEELLQQNTLWPEVDKLYGHAYEVMTVAVSHDGEIVATTCKAATAEHARIRLFSARTWKEISPPLELGAHSLTVTRIRFSPDDRYILGAGRDRYWSMFERRADYVNLINQGAKEDGDILYKFWTKCKAHARIIWDCSWGGKNGEIFATGSRDKTVKIWRRPTEGSASLDASTALDTLKFEESVTAVEFAPLQTKDRLILGVGLDAGPIYIYRGDIPDSSDLFNVSWEKALAVDPTQCHATTVRRLSFRPTQADHEEQEESKNGVFHLASCGDDHAVRLFRITA